ncbi:hypothetical protein GCM10023195_07860 [Actinoallomurus liliacearum]|uniref:DUF4158 domain-containing protein n=1 Tax=Actinoallomurus liliacearum TaxID=1080073 RepID=A0ABP8TCU8_9ACTN
MERLRSFPDIGREELIKYFTLTSREQAFLDAPGRGAEARLGLAVQLCSLPWLGFVPDDLLGVPRAALQRLASQLVVFPGALQYYVQSTRKRPQTRSDHLKLVMRYLKWKTTTPGGQEMKELEQFLLDRAMEHDTPSLLFQQATEHLISAKVVRPGVVTLMELVGAARGGAGSLTSEKVEHLLTGQMRADLDRLLVYDPVLGMTRLMWLTTPAVEATSAAVKLAIEKLTYLRGMDAHLLDLSMLPVLVDPAVADEDVGGLLRERIGMDKLREIASVNWKPLPRDHGRLATLEASYSYLRKFTPQVLEAIDFQGGPRDRRAARPGPRGPRRAAVVHRPRPPREHQLLRLHHRRRRGRTRQAHRRLAATAAHHRQRVRHHLHARPLKRRRRRASHDQQRSLCRPDSAVRATGSAMRWLQKVSRNLPRLPPASKRSCAARTWWNG